MIRFIEHDTAEYRRWYERGWRYSETSPNPTLEHGDRLDVPHAWYDGYLDSAAGRGQVASPGLPGPRRTPLSTEGTRS